MDQTTSIRLYHGSRVQRVIDILLNQGQPGSLSDIREIFRALPSQEAALLSACVIYEFTIADLTGDDGPGFVKTLISVLA